MEPDKKSYYIEIITDQPKVFIADLDNSTYDLILSIAEICESEYISFYISELPDINEVYNKMGLYDKSEINNREIYNALTKYYPGIHSGAAVYVYGKIKEKFNNEHKS